VGHLVGVIDERALINVDVYVRVIVAWLDSIVRSPGRVPFGNRCPVVTVKT
jgi:hypothetical protein